MGYDECLGFCISNQVPSCESETPGYRVNEQILFYMHMLTIIVKPLTKCNYIFNLYSVLYVYVYACSIT